MAGSSSISAGETAILRDVVEACHEPSETPLPPRVLELVRTLVHAEEVAFNCFDTAFERVRFQQCVVGDGTHEWEGDALTGPESEEFWRCYREPKRKWNLPEVTGDYTLVYTADDYVSLRQRRAWHTDSVGAFRERLIQAVLPDDSTGRHVRLTGWRDGSNFTHKDLLFLKLLQPHLERAYVASAHARRSSPRVTPQQLRVMRLVRAGLANREIAKRLDVSEGTVHNHLTNVFSRLGVQSRTAAAHAVFDAPVEWPAPSSAT